MCRGIIRLGWNNIKIESGVIMGVQISFCVRKIVLAVFLLLSLVACSSEEETEISNVTPEEISETANEISEDIVEEQIENQLNQTALPEFLKVLENNSEVKANYAACPINIFQKYKSYENHLLVNDNYEQQCSNDPAGCFKQCIEDRNGPMCHDLAYVLEGNEKDITPRYGRMMYAQACATGWPLSCTNRSAGIRNAMKEDDPFFTKDKAETNMCLNTTFEKMCDEKDAWGCYMTGSSYSYGDGRKIDEVKAEKFYKRACEVDPESGAC